MITVRKLSKQHLYSNDSVLELFIHISRNTVTDHRLVPLYKDLMWKPDVVPCAAPSSVPTSEHKLLKLKS